MQYAKLVLESGNEKTGPIPVSSTESSTCPLSCPMFKSCYAKAGYYTMLDWSALDNGRRGVEWSEFCDDVENLEDGTLWRHNVMGDLPGVNEKINGEALRQLVEANAGKRGFTYTHKKPSVGNNAAHILHANLNGFTVNISANGMHEVDALVALGIAPVVTVVPTDSPDVQMTEGGTKVVKCPAISRGLTCERCGLCQIQDRKYVIAFPAHGKKARMASEVAKG